MRCCYGTCMGVIISHSSAMKIWLSAVASGGDLPFMTRMAVVPKPNADAIIAARSYSVDTQDMHVLAPSPQLRVRFKGVCCHTWSGNLPPHSVARLAPEVFVSTPEFVFLQASSKLSLMELVRFGYELCALYTARLRAGELTELPEALTTSKKIVAFLDGCDGAFGVNKARLAAKWILDRSRSPRETKLAMTLTLPRRWGGQGVRGLVLNHEVRLSAQERKTAGKKKYEIDLYCENARIGLEYYGKETHAGPIRETKDLRRESILSARGIAIHGVTNRQAEEVMEIERLAKIIIQAQGGRWRKPTQEQERRMRQLLRDLYPQRVHW